MEWISVEDRFPETNGQYLCYSLYWEDYDICFFDGIFNSDIGMNPDYWMPLPEPPKK